MAIWVKGTHRYIEFSLPVPAIIRPVCDLGQSALIGSLNRIQVRRWGRDGYAINTHCALIPTAGALLHFNAQESGCFLQNVSLVVAGKEKRRAPINAEISRDA
jgi:hypothetical protein